jgi:hypothetical protein
VIKGGNGIVDGPVDHENWTNIMGNIRRREFGNREEENARFRISCLAIQLLVASILCCQMDLLITLVSHTD